MHINSVGTQCNSEHIHFVGVVSKAIITGIYLIVYSAGQCEAKKNWDEEEEEE